MDALAADANLATDTMSPSSHTRASVPALLTSQYPHRYFANFFGDVDFPTLSTYLSDADDDFTTAAFHSNPLISRHFGYDEGFDEFYDGLQFVESTRLPETITNVYAKLTRLLRRFPYEPAEAITKRAQSWLSDVREPFFLWVHYMDPHGPYALNRQLGYIDKYRSERLWQKAVSSPEEVSSTERKKLKAAYRGEVGHTDEHIGDLVDALDTMDETMVVLTGDHGEEFYEHGQYSHTPNLYETVTNVPLIIDMPDAAETVSPPTVPLSGLDIVPTILDAFDIEPRVELAGQSLIPALHGEQLSREHVIVETNLGEDALFGVRTQQWKYIVTDEGRELYDLSADPGEQNDLFGTEQEVESRLKEYLTSHVDAHDVEGGDKLAAVADDMDTEVQDRLNDLGYL